MVQHTETILLGCCNIFYTCTISTNHIIVFMTSDDRSDISAQETLGQNSLNNDVTCVPFPVPERDAALCKSWRPVLLGNIRNALCVSPLHFLCFTTALYSFHNCYWVCAQLPTVYSTIHTCIPLLYL